MSSIDWTDVAMLMSGLADIHEVSVEWTVTTLMPAGSGQLGFTALAWVPTTEAHYTEEVAQVTGSWPDKEHLDFCGFVFAKLYDLDRAIGRAYEQRKLKE